MIFSLFEIAIRMASIEGLHYRKDGEVEPRLDDQCRVSLSDGQRRVSMT